MLTSPKNEMSVVTTVIDANSKEVSTLGGPSCSVEYFFIFKIDSR
jgi:hypothetical protein